jgi:GNAT superfamily N-acetyltransferase
LFSLRSFDFLRGPTLALAGDASGNASVELTGIRTPCGGDTSGAFRNDEEFKRSINTMDGHRSNQAVLRVIYLEQSEPALPPALYWGSERVALERMTREAYLALYRRVGEPLRWDQRLSMPEAELAALLAGDSLHLYVLRDLSGDALGFCEFDRSRFPQIELKNFGLVPEAQGRGLGPWLLATALQGEWRTNPDRIWLHTDDWDHPAALSIYERAGFRVFDVRDEPPGPL